MLDLLKYVLNISENLFTTYNQNVNYGPYLNSINTGLD